MKKKIGKSRTVGKLSVVFAICVTMIMTSAITTIGATYKLGNQPFYSANLMTYSFEYQGPGLQATSVNGAGYTILSMPGCLAVGKQAGDPAVPVSAIQLMLPPKKTVSHVSVIGTPVTVKLSGIDLTVRPVMPEQKPVPFGSEEPQQFTINSDVYSSDAYYPKTLYSNEQVGYSHGYAILSLNLNPVQYNPKQGILVYYPKLTVVITLKTDATVNALYRNNPNDLAYVKTLVSNPEVADDYALGSLAIAEYPGGLCSPSQHYDYVIVTTTANGLDHWDIGGTLTYNWDSLIAEHNGDGLSSTEVTVQDINACPDYWNSSYSGLFNDTPAHIREFCKDAYSDWGTSYVLIGGDAERVPVRLLYYEYEGTVASDLYYSNLDNNFNANHNSQWGEAGDSGFDLYSELFVGRVVCEHPQDVSNWLTKSFYYADSTDADYLDNTGFYGGETYWDTTGPDFMDYSAIKGTSDWLGPNPDADGPLPTWAGYQYGFETWNANHDGNQFNLSVKYTSDTPNPGWNAGGAAGFRDAINNDEVTIISGIAHADNQMSLEVDISSWENDYHNTRPFFIHDYGCHCGDFNAGNGVLDAMLFYSDTTLAFGCVYNTGYGWGNVDGSTNSSSAFQAKQFWNYFLNMENYSGDYGNWQFGKGHAWSKDSMAPTIDWDTGSYGTWRCVIECCLLFADPAQQFKSPSPSQPPNRPTKPAGPALGIWHQEYTYTSTTTDPEGDQIYYLFDWGDGSNSGWLGPYTSGQTGVGSHTWTTLGTYVVKVKAKDIWGAGSHWSETLNVTITDNNPPLAPQITGPSHCEPAISYLFNFQTTDPQEDNIYYFIDWGDNSTSGWLGPYVSGFPIHVLHAYTVKSNYNLRAKAKDAMGAEGPWGNMTVSMSLDLMFGATQSQQLLHTPLMGQRLNQNG
jgi:hypothetical protein